MTDTTRRASGWPRTGKNQTATTAHSTSTGTAATPRTDDTARNNREAKWSARDGYSSQGTDGRTASGHVHTGRD